MKSIDLIFTLSLYARYVRLARHTKERTIFDPFYYLHMKCDVSDKYKFINHRISKVCTSTLYDLISNLDSDWRIHRQEEIPSSLTYKYKEYYHFVFIRNPWDRLVSCYNNRIKNLTPPHYSVYGQTYGNQKFDSMSFTDFVRFVNKVPNYLCDVHFVPQHCCFNQEEMNFIGRFESFEEDVYRLLDIIVPNHKELSIKRLNSSDDDKHYREYYTDETRDIVARKYRRDIELFNYKF